MRVVVSGRLVVDTFQFDFTKGQKLISLCIVSMEEVFLGLCLRLDVENSNAEPQRHIRKSRKEVYSQDQCSMGWDKVWESTVVPKGCSSVNSPRNARKIRRL